MRISYKTVLKRAEAIFIEKRSKFIATVVPVSEEQQAIEHINSMRSKYYNATHNVYAYIIDKNNIARFSDDGEPSGTAGVPVLEVLKKEELTDVCVVITRYFGGVLLGAGGLIRAYGHSCKLGVNKAKIITRTLCDIVELKCDYTMLGKILYEITRQGLTISDTKYHTGVTIYIYVPTDKTKWFLNYILDISNARVICEAVGKRYINF